METPPRRRVVTQESPSNSNGSSKPKTTQEKRFETVVDLLGYVQMPFALSAAMEERKNPGQISTYALDVFAIQAHKANISLGVVAVADEYPVLGAVLDKMSMGGPIMGLFVSVLALGAQIAENHNALPEMMQKMPLLGVQDRQDLAQEIANDVAKRQSENASTSEPVSATG